MNAKSPDTLKHTPGPWKVKDIFQDNGPNIIGIFGPRSATSGFNGFCVAHIAHSRDAALIASAPALLEACQKALADLQDVHELAELPEGLRLNVAGSIGRLIGVCAKAEGSEVPHV